MKYETIEAACRALSKKCSWFVFCEETVYPDYTEYTYVVQLPKSTRHITIRIYTNGTSWTNLTIDLMYAILREIGYTMYPCRDQDYVKKNLIWYYGGYFWNKGLMFDWVYDETGREKFNIPEETFAPTFIAALNHYLET